MKKPDLPQVFFLSTLLFIVGYFMFMIVRPFFAPLFLAIVFTALCAPLYHFFLKHMTKNKSVASLLTILISFFAILLPLIILGMMMYQEAVNLSALPTAMGGSSALEQFGRTLEAGIRRIVPSSTMHIDILGHVQAMLSWIEQNLNALFLGTLNLLFDALLIVIAMFVFYVQGERLQDFILKWSPLRDRYDKSILSQLEHALSSIMQATLATAVAQGVLVGIGFAIFGIPNPVLWGGVASVGALIPLIEANSVALPAALMLVLMHHPSAGIGLMIWSFFSIGIVDNFFRPMVIHRSIDIHPLLIFLSVLGGLAYFGPVGFIAGPVVLAFFFALLELYPTMIKGKPLSVLARE